MKKHFIIALPLLCLFLNSCGGGWSEKDKRQYRASCMAQAGSQISEANANKYCDCFVEQIVAKYPVFNDLTRGNQTDTIEALKKHCRNEIGLP